MGNNRNEGGSFEQCWSGERSPSKMQAHIFSMLGTPFEKPITLFLDMKVRNADGKRKRD